MQQLPQDEAQEIALGDRPELDVVLLTEIVPVLGKTPEAIVDRHQLEGLLWK